MTGFLAWVSGQKYSKGLDSVFLCIKAEIQGRRLDKYILNQEQELKQLKKELLERELEVLEEEKKYSKKKRP
jgi:hypothetical protein